MKLWHYTEKEKSKKKIQQKATHLISQIVMKFTIQTWNSHSPCPDQSAWVRSLNLLNSDNFILIHNMKLTSDHMEAVNILARNQYPNIQGLQLCEKIPEYILNKMKTLHYNYLYFVRKYWTKSIY